ncbi:hypothetical protein, partial [Mesorhizobium sp.]|uniref:hypothetical protein n=1 Tax=Mesorhizobium sp. TaxID=1871066 RepID=UPI0025F7A66F
HQDQDGHLALAVRHQGRRGIRHPDDELTGRILVCASSPPCGCGRAAGIKEGAEFVIPTMVSRSYYEGPGF